jgi:hypothetical protein
MGYQGIPLFLPQGARATRHGRAFPGAARRPWKRHSRGHGWTSGDDQVGAVPAVPHVAASTPDEIESFFLAILVHLSGINTVIDYAPMIFRSTGFTLDAALFSTFVVGAANFLFTLISF